MHVSQALIGQLKQYIHKSRTVCNFYEGQIVPENNRQILMQITANMTAKIPWPHKRALVQSLSNRANTIGDVQNIRYRKTKE